MKSLKLVTTFAIAAALMTGVTGCKKTPKNVTNIPRTNPQIIQDERPGGLLPGARAGTGVEGGGKLPGGGDITSGPGGVTSAPFDPQTAGIQNQRPPEGA